MNITMIAGTFYLIFLFCGVGYRGTSLLTAMIVILYVGLAGGGIPIQRAGYGSVLVLIAVLAGRPSSLLNSLCFAFFAILIGNPESLWNVGFQLSFLCVLSLILILPLFTRLTFWTLSLGSSLAVLCGTFPVVLYYFNIFSPVSVFANIVAIPLCDAALFVALFSILFHPVPFLNLALVRLASGLVGILLSWVRLLSTWRWGYWFLERPPLARLFAYYAALALLLFFYRRIFRGKRIVMVGLACLCLGLSVSFVTEGRARSFEVTFLASGRNQLAHARFQNGDDWLVNAGRSFPSDQGEWLIAPYLRCRGVQRLEGIWLTDHSGKHVGGLASVLRDFPVRHLIYPDLSAGSPEFYKVLRKLGRRAKRFQFGDSLSMDFENLSLIAQSDKGGATLIESGPWRILLIPRWDAAIFFELLEGKDDKEIHAVYLPPSGQGIPDDFYAWIDKVKPLLVVLPESQPDILASLALRGIPWFDLKTTGAMNFKRKGSRLEIVAFLKGPLGFYTFV